MSSKTSKETTASKIIMKGKKGGERENGEQDMGREKLECKQTKKMSSLSMLGLSIFSLAFHFLLSPSQLPTIKEGLLEHLIVGLLRMLYDRRFWTHMM